MSAGRIDHVAEAERFAAWADNPSLPPENVAAISSMAQVHATLALVEQQRIANLIALVALSGNENVQESNYDEGSTLSSAGMHALIAYERTAGTPISDPDDVPVVRSEIAEALGLS